MSIRRVSDHRSELLEQQSENGPALAPVPAHASGVVMKVSSSGQAFEAAPQTMVQFVTV
jgi:hypothetical protein